MRSLSIHKRLDPAWTVVVGCFAIMLCSGLVMWSFGVFFSDIQEIFEGTRSTVSSMYTTLIASNAAAAIATGQLSDKGHTVLVLQVSAVVGGGAIALCSQAHSLLQLAMLLVPVGVATGCTVPLAISTVQCVFHARRHSGLALAMVSSGIGLGALVFAPILSQVIITFGLTDAFLLAGVAFFALFTIGWAAIQRGGASAPRSASSIVPGTGTQFHSSVRRLLLSREYAAIAAISLTAVAARHVVTVHLVPFAGDIGVSQTVAALALGLIGGLSIPGRIGCGLISDSIGWGKTVRFSLLGTGTALLLLPLATSDWILLPLMILFGFWHGARAVGVMGLVGHVFKMQSVGQLVGTIIGASQLLGAIAPYLAGLLHDHTGSYRAIFVGLGSALLLLTLAVPHPSNTPADV